LGRWNDIKTYITGKWGDLAEEKVAGQVEKSRELGVFVGLVEDYTAKLKLGVRGDNAIRVSTFTLEKDADPIYRRFHRNDFLDRSVEEKPLLLQFHRLNSVYDVERAENVYERTSEKLYENSGADKRTGGGWEYNLKDPLNTGLGLKVDSLGNVISFLGLKNTAQFPEVSNENGGYPTEFSTVGSLDGSAYPKYTNYSFYVDTAFINRGTGWIKPQYLLAVDTLQGRNLYAPQGCVTCLPTPPGFVDYVLGRYLYNASMYAKEIDWDAVEDKTQYTGLGYNVNGSNVYDYALPVKKPIIHGKFGNTDVDGKAYVENTSSSSSKWERLAFAWAIHRGDELIVLKTNIDPTWGNYWKGDPQVIINLLLDRYGYSVAGYGKDINWNALKLTKGTPLSELSANSSGHKIGVHAIINLANNNHKDWVFSFRYFERGSDDFIIESETTNRDWSKGPAIRPGYSGWVKIYNEVPVISRSDTKELLQEGEYWNVELPTVAPVANDKVTSSGLSVTVIGGTGNVTIRNAAGKRAVISNLLGQTVANTVLSSDNASVAVPSGVVIVAVEGEKAVKAVVK
jgi:hypothetical protein